jgi:DNA-damage-inducible protein J
MEELMFKNATVRARIEPGLKKRVESLFHRLGLSTTEAITIFYRQVDLRNGLPFDVIIPNQTTRRTMEDTDAGRNLVLCKNADDMFKKLGI